MNPMLNSAMNSTMGLNAFMNQMMPQFNANNHNVFDFSLHSSSMQQGTESSANAVPVSTQNTFCIFFVPAYFVEKQFYHSRPFLKFLLIFICMHSFSSKSKKNRVFRHGRNLINRQYWQPQWKQNRICQEQAWQLLQQLHCRNQLQRLALN